MRRPHTTPKHMVESTRSTLWVPRGQGRHGSNKRISLLFIIQWAQLVKNRTTVGGGGGRGVILKTPA